MKEKFTKYGIAAEHIHHLYEISFLSRLIINELLSINRPKIWIKEALKLTRIDRAVNWNDLSVVFPTVKRRLRRWSANNDAHYARIAVVAVGVLSECSRKWATRSNEFIHHFCFLRRSPCKWYTDFQYHLSFANLFHKPAWYFLMTLKNQRAKTFLMSEIEIEYRNKEPS